MIRLRRFAAWLTGALLAITLAVLMLAVLLEGCGTSAAMMAWLFRTDAPAETTGLPDSEYEGMAQMITGYLSGTVEEFQYTLTQDNGTETVLFQEHEQQHMADCRALFLLCRKVILIAAFAVTLLVMILVLLKDRRRAAGGCLLGGGLALALVIGLCIWAAVDFDGIFVLFHQISFSNALWLLNPATDLLIRLMPTAFFVHYVILIAAAWILGLAVMLGISFHLRKKTQPA